MNDDLEPLVARSPRRAVRKPRKSRGGLVLAMVAAAAVAAPISVLLYAIAQLDPARFGPAVSEAVFQATGRQLSFSGPLRWSLLSLTPTLEADGVSVSNPPGFADPSLLSFDHVTAKIALLPLLSKRVDILDLVLTSPHLVLERDSLGNGDWNLTPPDGSTNANALKKFAVALEAVDVSGGDITLKTPSGRALVLSLTSLTGQAESFTAPLNLTAAAKLGDLPFTVSGQLGAISRLSSAGEGSWPVNLTFALGSASADLTGTVDDPRDLQGYDLKLDATIPALESLGANLPALHNITFTAALRDQGSAMPAIDGLALNFGASDLSALRPGLTLSTASLTLAGLDAPLNVAASGSVQGAPLTVQATLGAPAGLLPASWLPADDNASGESFPVNLVAQAGPAKLSLTGAIATPRTLAGAALAVNVAIPDLSALSALAGTPLPAWKTILLQTTLTDPGGFGLYQGIGLDSLTGTMDGAGFGGDATFPFTPGAQTQIALNFVSLDLDKLLAEWPAPPPPAPQAAATPAQPAPGTPAPPPLLIPDTPLSFTWLKGLNAQLQLSADQMSFGHQAFTALQGQVTAANGVLALNPFTGQLPGGAVTAAASIDASAAPAKFALALNAPALALPPLLTSLHLDSDNAQGIVSVQVKASSQGDTLHQLASALAAQIGVASVNATIDGGLIQQLFGAVLGTAGLGDQPQITAPGPLPLRCAALRLDASNGTTTLSGFDFDSGPVTILAAGGANLGAEALNFAISPQPRTTGQPGTPPPVVTLTGSFSAPILALQAPPSASPSDITQTPLPAANAPPAAPLPQAVLPAGTGDDCPATLAMARFGATGPAPEPLSTIAPQPAPPSQPGPAPSVPHAGGGPTNLNSLLGQ